MNNARQYHYQADVDIYAKKDDTVAGIITATMKQIQEAYQELMDDLLLESQEAY